ARPRRSHSGPAPEPERPPDRLLSSAGGSHRCTRSKHPRGAARVNPFLAPGTWPGGAALAGLMLAALAAPAAAQESQSSLPCPTEPMPIIRVVAEIDDYAYD